ncbi:hypothetical protein FOL47_006885 [Perkinsus chesapeaki]|uniref:Uncharacterized protein n=1 Tax=Perkinsus chesapeaki TaxID=330153 RepID=A0A7J6LNW3_PERCH|nr:hypothetical protein FOL47_006885 [Perkinsus chesapeaki]
MPTCPTSPPYSASRPHFTDARHRPLTGASREDVAATSDRKTEEMFWSPSPIPVVPKLLLECSHSGSSSIIGRSAVSSWNTEDSGIEFLERALMDKCHTEWGEFNRDRATEKDLYEKMQAARSFTQPSVTSIEPPMSPPPLIDLRRQGRASRYVGRQGKTDGPIWRRKMKECAKLRELVRRDKKVS